VRVGDAEIAAHVKAAVHRLYSIYPDGRTDVVLSANVVLESNVSGSMSLFYGQDFSGIRDYTSHVVTLRDAQDWVNIPVDLGPEHFEGLFNRLHADSDVHVSQVVSYIFIMRHWLQDYEKDHTVGRKLRKLY
jgi:hypothetical protein